MNILGMWYRVAVSSIDATTKRERMVFEKRRGTKGWHSRQSAQKAVITVTSNNLVTFSLPKSQVMSQSGAHDELAAIVLMPGSVCSSSALASPKRCACVLSWENQVNGNSSDPWPEDIKPGKTSTRCKQSIGGLRCLERWWEAQDLCRRMVRWELQGVETCRLGRGF